MSGGGSKYFSDSDAKTAIERLRDAEESTARVRLDSEVSTLIGEILKDYNERRPNIGGHLESIKAALEKEIEGSIELRFGGSISKHTYVDGLSDVDSLVIINNCELAEAPPNEAKHYFAERLRERFPNSDIREGDLAVTVSFRDVNIQLIPTIKCEGSVKMSNSSGDAWTNVNPQKFAEKLTKVNERMNGKLVPMIKIAKGMNSELPDKQRLKSYHLESIAIEIFKKYEGKVTTKKMLQHFFSEAPKVVMNNIKDNTGQTIHVDDYLGVPESSDRRLVANALGRLGRKMVSADFTNSLEQWNEILN